MSDDKLRALYSRGMRRRATTDRASCVSPERIRAAVERRGPVAERHATLEHVASCPFCREDYNLLRSVTDVPPRRRVLSRPLVFAAGALAAAAAVVVLARQPARPKVPDDVVRGGGAPVVTVAPQGELGPGAPVVLTWRPVPAALDYDVELLRADGTLVTSARTRDTTVAVADSLTAESGAVYRWWVQARLTDGSRRRSEPTTFRRAER